MRAGWEMDLQFEFDESAQTASGAFNYTTDGHERPGFEASGSVAWNSDDTGSVRFTFYDPTQSWEGLTADVAYDY